jgi:hypothetical protein
MSLFKKPTKDDRRLKMYVFGDAGTGKTITSLHMPSPAVIDLEGGTHFYVDKFDFTRIMTADVDAVNNAVDELIENPGEIKTLVLDSFSVYWDLLQDKHLKRLRLKKGKADYTFQPIDYKLLNADAKAFINKLLALDMNIVATARPVNEYAEGGEFMKVVGKKPYGPKEAPHLFDVVLELRFGPDDTRIAKVIKDRTNTLPKEFEYSYQELIKYVDMKELERAPVQLRAVQKLNQGNNRTTEITLDGKRVMTAGIALETLTKLRELIPNFGEQELKDKLYEDYLVQSLLDL